MNEDLKDVENQALQLAMNGFKVIRAPETEEGIIQLLQAEDKVTGLATALVEVINIVESKFGRDIDDKAKVAAGNYILQELIDVGKEMGLFEDLTEDEKIETVKQAVKMYAQMGIESGKYKREDFAQQGATVPGSGPPQVQGQKMQGQMQGGLIQEGNV
jgi:hypothetical protein